ncbi:MAG: class I tRNA ligase family protein, partial [Anaerolineales bacterium]
DDLGRKMSKTLGNVIDPLDVMNEFGTDALRFTLLVGSTPGQDVNLSLEKVAANRNFANKLWNASRFVIGALPSAPKAMQGELEPTLADAWIWARTKQVLAACQRLFESNQYGEAGRQVYEFFWTEFADWYIEIAKLQLGEGGDRAYKTCGMLVSVLDTCLRLLHPFTPFITEELWRHLKVAAQEHSAGLQPDGGWPAALIIAAWPEPLPQEGWEPKALLEFALFQDVVRAIRNQRAEKGVKPGQKLPGILTSAEHAGMLEREKNALASLAQLDAARLTILANMDQKPEGHAALVAGPVEVYLSLAESVDPAKERERLGKEMAAALEQATRLEKLLASDFARKAPPAVVEKEKGRLAGFLATAASLAEQLKKL